MSCLRAALRRAVWLAEAAGLAAALAIFACLPLDVASALGARIGRAVGPRLGVSRRALQNLRHAFPENGEAENRRILLGMWDNLGRTLAELPHLDEIVAEGSGRIEIVGGPAFVALAAEGRPLLLFGAHVANWEAGTTAIGALSGRPCLTVYRAANNPYVDRLMRRLRRRHAVAKGAEGGRDVLRELMNGGEVAMMVDQKLNDGIAVPFFGREAMTAPAMARLALRFSAPMVPIRMERLQGARFRLEAVPPLFAASSGDLASDVLATMTRINALLESWIRARPEQWLWVHQRWPD